MLNSFNYKNQQDVKEKKNVLENINYFIYKYNLLCTFDRKSINNYLYDYLLFIRSFIIDEQIYNISFFKRKDFFKKLIEFFFILKKIQIQNLSILFVSTSSDTHIQKFITYFCIKYNFYYAVGRWPDGILTNQIISKKLKIEKNFDTFYVPQKPDFIFLFDPQNSSYIIKEAYDAHIPIIAVVNGASDPRISFALFGNNAFNFLIIFYCRLIEFIWKNNR